MDSILIFNLSQMNSKRLKDSIQEANFCQKNNEAAAACKQWRGRQGQRQHPGLLHEEPRKKNEGSRLRRALHIFR
jgi:hypothetical protein